jgi:hypothetical protein
MTVFGAIVTGGDVEVAVIGWLKHWLPTYLAEMERRTGRAAGVLPMPRSWLRKNRFDRQPPDQLPAAILISPGLAGKPVRNGDGSLAAWWRIELAIVCAGRDEESSNELAKLYGAAIRTLALQHPALTSAEHPAGFASSIEIAGEGYDGVPADYLPVGATVAVDLNVQVAEIANAYGGPAVPDLAPSDWPEIDGIDDVHITLTKETP